MIKRTLYFGNPAYLSRSNDQLLIKLPQVEKNDSLTEEFKKIANTTIPIEDIGIVILDHQQITITQALIAALLENNAAVITCDSTHHPTGLLLNLCGNTVQTERFRVQIDSSLPLRKQLWAQTVAQKIKNQASVLDSVNVCSNYLVPLYSNIRSGDADNCEAVSAAYYWSNIFSDTANHGLKNFTGFRRFREGPPPNNLLNYGYAILRAVMARSIVAAGLLTTLGIHHRNRYNAYCLADDLMEPYRPIVDATVIEILKKNNCVNELTKETKALLLQIPVKDVIIDKEKSPLMIATQRTAVSLVKCFEGEQKKIAYPTLPLSEGD